MKFTYDAYGELIEKLRRNGYIFSDYYSSDKNKTVILRHDVDISVSRALDMARFENEIGVTSTYFVLISSSFYNCFSKTTLEQLHEICALGHDVGLHFDEEKYNKDVDTLTAIENEIDIFESLLDMRCMSVSMHRPSKSCLESNYVIKQGKVVNSYCERFFKDYKYVSDSRRCWREDIEAIIDSQEYHKLHILTHPALYNYEEESYKNVLVNFCNERFHTCYEELKNNISQLDEIVSYRDIFGDIK